MLAECGSVYIIDNCSYKYRQHEQSMVKKSDWSQTNGVGLRSLVDFLRNGVGTKYPNEIDDFLLNLFLIHSGGRIDGEFVFDCDIKGRDLVLYSGGTFGQYIMKGSASCGLNFVNWIDDDCEEYGKCGLKVNPVRTVADTRFDYVLIASTNSILARSVKRELESFGADADKIVYYDFSADFKKMIFERYLNRYYVYGG